LFNTLFSPGSCFIVNQGGFTAHALAEKGNRKKLGGRNIIKKALALITTLREAYNFDSRLFSANGDNPSETNGEDVLLCVHQQCYVKCEGEKNMKLACNNINTDEMFHPYKMLAKYFLLDILLLYYMVHKASAAKLLSAFVLTAM
jgi:hypothetical protein